MRPKDATVDLGQLHPELRKLEPILDLVYIAFGREAIVTSANDGTHRKGSLHYRDAAIDLRVKNIALVEADQSHFHQALKRQVELAYPGEFDILLEGAGGPNVHIHAEFSPRMVAMHLGGSHGPSDTHQA